MLPPTQRRNGSVRGGDWHVGTRWFMGQCSLGAEAVAPTAAETKGSSKRVTAKEDELTSSKSPEQSL